MKELSKLFYTKDKNEYAEKFLFFYTESCVWTKFPRPSKTQWQNKTVLIQCPETLQKRFRIYINQSFAAEFAQKINESPTAEGKT